MQTLAIIAEKLKIFGRAIKNEFLYNFLRRGDEDPSIMINDDGITITKNGRALGTMRWADMRRAVFFQKDMFTFELIYAGFYDADGNYCGTDELMRGYHEFCKAADERFPGFKDVEGHFGWNAAGRFSKVEPLWLDLEIGKEILMPDGYVTRRPGWPKIPF